VADYKLYFVDPKGHIFKRVDVLSAAKDEALSCARELSADTEIEIWRGATFLGRYLIGGTFRAEPRASGEPAS
jgi:hypothetical protein